MADCFDYMKDEHPLKKYKWWLIAICGVATIAVVAIFVLKDGNDNPWVTPASQKQAVIDTITKIEKTQ